MTDKIACREVGCNLTAEVSERIGTTSRYFEYCPACGAKHSLTIWTVEQ